MKVLILGSNQKERYNRGHTLFRESFKRHHDVDFYGPEYVKYKSIQDAVKNFKPNIIFSNYNRRTSSEYNALKKINNIPKVIRPQDYLNHIDWNTKKIYKQRRNFWRRDFEQFPFDLYFAENGAAYNWMLQDKIGSVRLLPFSVETNLFKKLKTRKDFDVMASFTIARPYPLRQEVVDLIKKMPLKSIAGHRISVKGKYINAINRSKIFVIPNGQIKSLNLKYFEVLACGTFLLCQEPVNYEELGFKKGKNFATWTDLKDLKKKIWYYLRHTRERETIAKNGAELIKKRHSNDIRVKEWTKIINDKFHIE